MKFEFTNWKTQENPWPGRISQKTWRNLNIVSLILMVSGTILNILAHWVIKENVAMEALGSVLLSLGILVVIAGMKPVDEYEKIFKRGFATVIIIGLIAICVMGSYKIIPIF